MATPYDQRLANESNAAEQCMKLGAVLLKPPTSKPTGFAPPPQPREPT